jgi:ADP-heptose:LPS heptosyltransferase/GT2 family glycosyltransferase
MTMAIDCSAPRASKQRIVVVALDTFGDLVLRQPLFASLLDQGSAVTVVVRAGYEGIVPFLDSRLEALVADVNPYSEPDPDAWRRLQELGTAIDRLDPDLLVSAVYNRSYIDEWLLSRRQDIERIGFANPMLPLRLLEQVVMPAGPPIRAEIFSRVVHAAPETSEAEKYSRLLFEISGRDVPQYLPVLSVPQYLIEEAGELVRGLGLEPGSYVIGCPAATVSTPHKAWNSSDYVELAVHLQRAYRLPVMITGVQSEAELLDEIVDRGVTRGVRIRRWIGRREDLGLLLGVVRHSRFYLGSDSGPMHFAAALGVPVVALFGGGHWPQFLPLAVRSFVATQKLPCFRCGWQCCLEAPLCVSRVPVEKFISAIDWILSGAPDERRVDTGQQIDTLAEEALASAVTASRATITELRRRLKESDVDRAARLAIIKQMGESLKASEADRAARLEVIHDFQKQLGESQSQNAARADMIALLEAQLAAAESDSLARLEAIRNLERRIVEISSAKATVKRLAGIIARKSGVYPVLKRREDVARRVYRRFHGRPGGLPPRPAGPADLRPSIHSPLVDAFVAARSMPGDAEDAALEALYRIGADGGNVLCLGASQRVIPALFMLARGGARVTCLDCRHHEAELQSYGVEAVRLDPARWLIASERTSLKGFDAVLLDAELSAETVKLAAGRFANGQAVVVLGPKEHVLSGAWGLAPQRVGNLDLYKSAPPAWLDPENGAATTLPSGRPWPRISVVTVTYNQADYLEETLQSVLGQGYPDLEYIVLDGKSTDRTPEILERYRDRLAYCVSEKDAGQSDALNKGFHRATGEILAWLNSDDRYLPGALHRVALAFDSYGADVVAGGCAMLQDRQAAPFGIHHNSLPLGKVVPLPLDRLLDIEGSWIKGDFFWQPEVFWTRHIWERSGGRVAQDLFYSMDYELWVRMAQSGACIVHIPDSLAVYRMHARQKTSGTEPPYLPELRQLSAEIQRGMKSS